MDPLGFLSVENHGKGNALSQFPYTSPVRLVVASWREKWRFEAHVSRREVRLVQVLLPESGGATWA